MNQIDIRKGDEVVYRRTRARAATSATVVQANRVNLACTAPYQLGAVGIGEVLTLNLSLPRAEVDEVWRDGVKVFDSGRAPEGSQDPRRACPECEACAHPCGDHG